MATIPLVSGGQAVVDDDLADTLAGWKWYRDKDGYAFRTEYVGPHRSNRTIRMHRAIIGAPVGVLVDHIDGDPCNNRRENLRLCTNAQNQANAHRRRGVSKYRGVCWNRRSEKWQAGTKIDGRQRHLGVFVDEADAARAVDAALLAHFGEFAHLNFPTQRGA